MSMSEKLTKRELSNKITQDLQVRFPLSIKHPN